MKKTSKFTFIVFLIGANFLAACSQAAASTAEPSSPSETPPPLTAKMSDPLTAAMPVPLPQAGFLAPGTYFMAKIPSTADYQQINFTLPAGWATSDGLVYKHLDQPGEVAFSAWIVDRVYADPCHWQGSALSPLDLAYATEVANHAIVSEPGEGDFINQALRGPRPRTLTQVMLGGLLAQRMDLSVPADLDISTCDNGEFRSWTGRTSGGEGANSHNTSGQLDSIYLVNLDRRGLVIDASHMPATSEADLAELEAILASMSFGQGGPVETPPPPSLVGLSGPVVAPWPGVVLDPGTYTYADVDGEGFNVRFTIPAGWTWTGRFLYKGGFDRNDSADIYFLGGPVQVYTDPCHWAGAQLKSYTGSSVIDALVAQPARIAKKPIDRPANSMSEAKLWPGRAVEMTVSTDLDLLLCTADAYQGWGPEISAQSYEYPGMRDYVWAVDVPGAGVNKGNGVIITALPPGSLIIDATSSPETPAHVISEIDAILASVIIDRGDLVETPSPASSEQIVGPTTWLEGPSGAAAVPGTLLDPGTYNYLDVDWQGFNVRFTVPAGWTWNGINLSRGGGDQTDGAAIFFFGGRVPVNADPCHWAGVQSKSNWLSGTSVIDALVNQPMGSATTPIYRPAGDWPGMAVELTVPDYLNLTDCIDHQYQRWGHEINILFHEDPGQRDYVWTVDISGAGLDDGNGVNVAPPPPGGLIIDAASFPGTPADVMSEIEAILGSIVVGHWE